MTAPASLLEVLAQLAADGVLQRDGARYRTTPRWRAAIRRTAGASQPASTRLDLRNPIVQALLALYGSRRELVTLTPFVSVLLAIESSERPPG